MIVKIFKISTKEMYTFKNSTELRSFIIKEVGGYPSHRYTIKELVQRLPVENYYRVR